MCHRNFQRFVRNLLLNEAYWIKERVYILNRMNYYDDLMGCYNYEGFKIKAKEIILGNQDKIYQVCYLDIKQFKFINDYFGYEKGDSLLRHWSEAISEVIDEDGIVGRISRDNVVVLALFESEEASRNNFKYIADSIEHYLYTSERQYKVETCAGVYVFDPKEHSDSDINHLLDYANIAQKKAKAILGSNMLFCDAQLWESEGRTSRIRHGVNDALSNGEIAPWFQPQYDYVTGQIIGAEVLARWNSAELGVISPEEFVPVLEESGQIFLLDHYIWDKACGYMKRWKESGKNLSVSLSVNISRNDMLSIDVCRYFENLVEEYGLTPDMLRLEITESAYVKEMDVLIDIVSNLRKCGFKVEMDDFGSGFSSLNMLKDMSVDALKMDLKFLSETNNNARAGNIISSVIRMAHALDIDVIAEGVETEEQAKLLKNMGCCFMQGYFFAKPMDADAFEKLIMSEPDNIGSRNRQKDNRINLTELLDSRSNASFIFNSCIGAAMLFEYRSESIEVILANDDYFDLIDSERMLFKKLRHNLLDNLDAERRAMAIASVEEAIANKTHSCDIKVDSCGKNIRVSMRHVNSADEGHIIFAVFEDITETLQIKEELTQQWVQTKYKTLTRIPGTITYDYDPENDVLTIDVCKNAGNIKTVSAERFLDGGECSWLDDESMEKHRQVFREALKSPTSGSMDFRVKFTSNGDYIWYRSYYTSVTDYSGKVYRIVGRSDSIEKDMRIAADWKKRACHDALTGMLNHDATIEVLKKRIIESGGGALVLVDIDNFRCINESLGHVKGNNILKNIADTIKKVFRKEDMLGRFGGDEFVIFLQGVLNRENVEIRVKSLVYALQDIYIENDLKVCASIGVAIDTSGRVSAYELLEYAESAMLHAKKEADERYYFYGNSSAIPDIAGESCLHE